MVDTKRTRDLAGADPTYQRTAADLGVLVFRVVFAAFFFYHGVWHFQIGMVRFSGLMESVHVPAPTLTAYVVALFEIVAGLCLIVGLATRALSAVGILMMLVTGFHVKIAELHTGFLGANGSGGAETDFLYLLCFLVLLSVGAGRYSLDRVVQTDSQLANLLRNRLARGA